MNWWLAGLILALIALIVAVLGVAILLARIHEMFSSSLESLRQFLSAPDDKSPSQFALVLDQAGQIVGKRVAMELKVSLMGKASAASRAVAGAEADLQGEAVQASQPLLAGLIDASPGLAKRLRKSPSLMGLLMELAPRVLGGGGGGLGAGGHSRGNGNNFNLGV